MQPSANSPPRVVELGRVAYLPTWQAMQHFTDVRDAHTADEIWVLEHEPVFTLGMNADPSHVLAAGDIPVVRVDRGGQVTYHGPGQLVGYPVLDLNSRGRDLHAHLRSLEEALILACQAFGVDAQRREGLTGVWVADRKLASIGVGVRKWISMHGFAINITRESLPPFFAITPCGIDGVVMSCLETEAGRSISVREAAEVIGEKLRDLFALTPRSR